MPHRHATAESHKLCWPYNTNGILNFYHFNNLYIWYQQRFLTLPRWKSHHASFSWYHITSWVYSNAQRFLECLINEYFEVYTIGNLRSRVRKRRKWVLCRVVKLTSIRLAITDWNAHFWQNLQNCDKIFSKTYYLSFWIEFNWFKSRAFLQKSHVLQYERKFINIGISVLHFDIR